MKHTKCKKKKSISFSFRENIWKILQPCEVDRQVGLLAGMYFFRRLYYIIASYLRTIRLLVCSSVLLLVCSSVRLCSRTSVSLVHTSACLSFCPFHRFEAIKTIFNKIGWVKKRLNPSKKKLMKFQKYFKIFRSLGKVGYTSPLYVFNIFCFFMYAF